MIDNWEDRRMERRKEERGRVRMLYMAGMNHEEKLSSEELKLLESKHSRAIQHEMR